MRRMFRSSDKKNKDPEGKKTGTDIAAGAAISTSGAGAGIGIGGSGAGIGIGGGEAKGVVGIGGASAGVTLVAKPLEDDADIGANVAAGAADVGLNVADGAANVGANIVGGGAHVVGGVTSHAPQVGHGIGFGSHAPKHEIKPVRHLEQTGDAHGAHETHVGGGIGGGIDASGVAGVGGHIPGVGLGIGIGGSHGGKHEHKHPTGHTHSAHELSHLKQSDHPDHKTRDLKDIKHAERQEGQAHDLEDLKNLEQPDTKPATHEHTHLNHPEHPEGQHHPHEGKDLKHTEHPEGHQHIHGHIEGHHGLKELKHPEHPDGLPHVHTEGDPHTRDLKHLEHPEGHQHVHGQTEGQTHVHGKIEIQPHAHGHIEGQEHIHGHIEGHPHTHEHIEGEQHIHANIEGQPHTHGQIEVHTHKLKDLKQLEHPDGHPHVHTEAEGHTHQLKDLKQLEHPEPKPREVKPTQPQQNQSGSGDVTVVEQTTNQPSGSSDTVIISKTTMSGSGEVVKPSHTLPSIDAQLHAHRTGGSTDISISTSGSQAQIGGGQIGIQGPDGGQEVHQHTVTGQPQHQHLVLTGGPQVNSGTTGGEPHHQHITVIRGSQTVGQPVQQISGTTGAHAFLQQISGTTVGQPVQPIHGTTGVDQHFTIIRDGQPVNQPISGTPGTGSGKTVQYSSSFHSAGQPTHLTFGEPHTTITGAVQRINASMDDVRKLTNDGQLNEWLQNEAKASAHQPHQITREYVTNERPTNFGISNGDLPSTHVHNTSITSKFSVSSPNVLDDKDRPMSPTTRLISLSRIDEKNALVSLNDRLASILTRNRQLEQENVLLHTQLRDANTKLTLITNELTKTFEEETNTLRIMLQVAEKDKLRLEMNLKKLQTDYNVLIDKIRSNDDEITNLNRTIKTLQARIASLTMDLKGRDDDRQKLTREKAEFQERLVKVTKELEEVQNMYETEAITKVDLEHQLRHKEDEVQMKMQVHQQQFSELMITRNEETNHVSGQLRLEYDARLADAIRQLRADCELQLHSHREEQEALYNMKQQALHGEIQRLRVSLEGQGGEVGNLTLKLTTLERKLMLLSAEKSHLEEQLRDLEHGWAGDKSSFAAERTRLEQLIGEMQAERFQLLTDYQQLMEIKVGLDNEIATYRSLLESEEERLARLLEQAGERMKLDLEDQITPSFEIKRTVNTVTETTPEYYPTSALSGIHYTSDVTGGHGGTISYTTPGVGGGSGIGYTSHTGGTHLGGSHLGGGGGIGIGIGGGAATITTESSGVGSGGSLGSSLGGSFRTSSPGGPYSYTTSTEPVTSGATQTYKYETRF